MSSSKKNPTPKRPSTISRRRSRQHTTTRLFGIVRLVLTIIALSLFAFVRVNNAGLPKQNSTDAHRHSSR